MPPVHGRPARLRTRTKGSRLSRLADLAAYLYVGFLTLAVAAHLGAVALIGWTLAATWITYRKAARA